MPKPTPIANGAIFQDQGSAYIFEDNKARRVGDILTIVLTEKTNATKSATTNTKKEDTADTGLPTVFGRGVTVGGANVLSNSIESTQEFKGQGDSSQSNALNGTISVMVTEVLPNGNLLIRGQKRLTLNQGDEYIQISGIVRQLDISMSNTVPSTLVADSRITYSGYGAVSDSNQMGWLARFFNSPYWPL
jgi:flagellar L-ring protein precursor FlgH